MPTTKLDTFFFISILSIPLLLITGPFLPDLVLTLSTIVFLIFFFLKKEIKINYYFTFFFLSFFSIMIISSILSNQLNALIKTLVYLRFFFFTSMVIYILSKYKNRLNYYLFYVLLFTFAYLLVEGFYQFFFHKTLIFQNKLSNMSRLYLSSFSENQVYSSYIVRVLPIFLALLFFNLKKLSYGIKNLSFSIIILSCLIVLLNGERSSAGYLLLFILLFVFNNKFEINQKKIIFFLSLIFITSLALSSKSLKLRYVEGSKYISSTLNSIINKDKKVIFFTDKYHAMYMTSYKIFINNSFFGIGPNTFRINCNKVAYNINEDSCSTHPHNTYFQLLAETGFFGFLIITLVFFIMIFYLCKYYRRNTYLTYLVTCVIISLWPFFPTGNFFNNWLSIIYFYPIGFIINELNQKLFKN